jgi:hypothetical protein
MRCADLAAEELQLDSGASVAGLAFLADAPCGPRWPPGSDSST